MSPALCDAEVWTVQVAIKLHYVSTLAKISFHPAVDNRMWYVITELKRQGYLCSGLVQSTQHKEHLSEIHLCTTFSFLKIHITHVHFIRLLQSKTFWDPYSGISLIHCNDGLIVNHCVKQNGLAELTGEPQVCYKQISNILAIPLIDIFKYICLCVISSYVLCLTKPWNQAAKWLFIKNKYL